MKLINYLFVKYIFFIIDECLVFFFSKTVKKKKLRLFGNDVYPLKYILRMMVDDVSNKKKKKKE